MLPTNYPRACPSPGCCGPTRCLRWKLYTSVGVGRINRSPSSCMLYVRSTHPHPGQRPVVDAVPETNRRPGGQGPAHTHTPSRYNPPAPREWEALQQTRRAIPCFLAIPLPPPSSLDHGWERCSKEGLHGRSAPIARGAIIESEDSHVPRIRSLAYV
ncbi:hypothetical protein CCHR01_12562 [Colletotrichum chrysophilum]|uniref:Uncharacterized protein n=1 Tax=Colletotrichum chrysophilum TaxID=1836956 RepID=A0AAD9AB43_9PEZI|nr:hypothetical protein CCHR01_12562 [Colletotrichum chrysophilum]